MLDITTIGAGGGSIVWVDPGGALRVGPQSAGAQPGPICYGKGGEKITVTDCNLLAGYLGEEGLLGGKMPLLKGPPEKKIAELSKSLDLSFDESVLGVQKIVNSNMINAIRLTLARYGLDPRDFALVAFGGAGPMHACSLAKELGIKKIIIPYLPGAYSAYGILVSDIRSDLSKSILKPLEEAIKLMEGTFSELKDMALEDLKKQGISEGKTKFLFSLDLRYHGQSYEINVDLGGDLSDKFNKKHKRLYGYSNPGEQIEVVNIRLRTITQRSRPNPPNPGEGNNEPTGSRMMLFEEGPMEGKVYFRGDLSPGLSRIGPAVIYEETATTVIPPDFGFSVDEFGVIHLEVL
jgi:N-methylhydantoinase A/oxoprolinase/acetone carboxylase beta subunit